MTDCNTCPNSIKQPNLFDKTIEVVGCNKLSYDTWCDIKLRVKLCPINKESHG